MPGPGMGIARQLPTSSWPPWDGRVGGPATYFGGTDAGAIESSDTP